MCIHTNFLFSMHVYLLPGSSLLWQQLSALLFCFPFHLHFYFSFFALFCINGCRWVDENGSLSLCVYMFKCVCVWVGFICIYKIYSRWSNVVTHFLFLLPFLCLLFQPKVVIFKVNSVIVWQNEKWKKHKSTNKRK